MAHRIGKIQKTRISATEIDLDVESKVFYGTAGSAVLGYDGQGLHHTVYVHAAPGTVALEVSTNGTNWTPAASTSAAGVISTGNLYEVPPKFTRVTGSSSANNKITVVSFSSLIPSP